MKTRLAFNTASYILTIAYLFMLRELVEVPFFFLERCHQVLCHRWLVVHAGKSVKKDCLPQNGLQKRCQVRDTVLCKKCVFVCLLIIKVAR